jgi:hypothetical protein
MSEAQLGCPEVEALAPEFALGAVTATERASALVHIRQCQSCQRLVDELSTVADGLLLLAPHVEPTIGFESRVLAASGAPERQPERRRRVPAVRVAAAAAALVVASSLGLLAGLALSGGADQGDDVRTGFAVSPNGLASCRVFAFGDQQAWVFVNLKTPREWTADYVVEVTTAEEGESETLGRLRLQGGEATLGTTVDYPAERLRSVRVLNPAGEVWYEAVLKA